MKVLALGSSKTLSWPWLVAVLGCAASSAVAAEAPHAADKKTITVYHWWASSSESAAFNALSKAFVERYPAFEVTTGRLVGGRSLRDQFPAIQKLIAQRHSPDAVQANAGYAAQLFYDAQLLGAIDDLWASEKLEAVIPPLIRDLNKFDGHYYSVPVNVHRTNVVWYNKALLDKYKIDPATLTTWEAFFKAAQTLRAAGVESPIQMGELWTGGHVFECIMASLGLQAYAQWINGEMTRSDDARVIKAWTIFERYLTFVNRDHADVPWDAAIKRVMKGEGAFCIMGDWANGEFQVAGQKYGKDYGTFVVPETQGMYGLIVDVFLHPRGSDDLASRRWLAFAASREGQDAFNPLKGSVPARTDADPARYDAYQRSALQELKTAHLYPNRAEAVPEGLNRQLYNTVEHFMNVHHDLDRAAREMTDIDAAAKTSAVGASRRVWTLK
jgi:glucose/mannose transport system substrate-binding protein